MKPGATADAVAVGLRRRHIAALTRRAALQQGDVRRLLDERLLALQVAVDAVDAVDAAPKPGAAGTAGTAGTPYAPARDGQRSALAELLVRLAPPGAAATPPGQTPQQQPAPELKALRDYRSTWSRLAVEQRLHQALARVPPNAGPLNTQRLVHQALTALRDASPAYLHRLVAQVEALLWLEQLGQGGAAASATANKKPKPAAPTGSSRS